MEGIEKMKKETNPTQGDLLRSIVRETTICICVGPGKAKQRSFIYRNWDGLTQFFYLTNNWCKYSNWAVWVPIHLIDAFAIVLYTSVGSIWN